MIDYLEISVDRETNLNDFYRHIQYNILFHLRNDKQIKKLKRVNINLILDSNEISYSDEISFPEGKICTINVKVNPNFLLVESNKETIILQLLEKLYVLNGWDTLHIAVLRKKFIEKTYIIDNIIFKIKRTKLEGNIEVINRYYPNYIEFSIRVSKEKQITDETVFFKSIINPHLIKYRFYSYEINQKNLIISDYYNEISTIFNLYTKNFETIFQPNKHDLKLLKDFDECLKFDSKEHNISNIFSLYANC